MASFFASCNTCLADSPLGVGGRSARHRPDIYLDGCGTHLSFLTSSSLRPEPSGARALAPSSPLPSISLLWPPNLDSSRGNLPRHLLHLPKPLDRLLTAGIIPRHRRSPLEVLEALLHVDPLLRSSSTRTDRGNGFVVSFLCFPVFFPFRGVSPAPVNGRRRRRTYCRQRCGSEARYRGRSAWEARTVRRSG